MKVNLIRKIEKRVNDIVQISGKMPEEMEMAEKAYKQLVEECLDFKVIDCVEVLNKNGNPLNKFMGMEIKINNNVDEFKILK